MDNSVQCTMRKGNSIYTAWIPEEYAKVGNVVRLKTESGWVDGWEVIEAGNKMPSKYIRERSHDWKNTRKASDI